MGQAELAEQLLQPGAARLRIADTVGILHPLRTVSLVDALRLAGPTPDAEVASGAKVAALLEALALRPDVQVPAGPLLLIDARYRSGWSMTVAAAPSREIRATASAAENGSAPSSAFRSSTLSYPTSAQVFSASSSANDFIP